MDKFSWPEPPSQTAFPIARAGYPIIFFAAFATAIFALLEWPVLAMTGLGLTIFITLFFRDPDRIVPDREGAVVSPADGKVVFIGRVDKTPFDDEAVLKISIFMSVFNAHVNRIPCGGIVRKIQYHPGKFFAASLDKASDRNERNAFLLETQNGRKIGVVQIAGLIARRIICGLRENDVVTCGQRFGMICFGSRVDLYLPIDMETNVIAGDNVKAGTSLLGHLK
jgi:phosphatidylserine decarboxylase